jgi:hypothetical protein
MIELELGNGESAVQLLGQAVDALPTNYRRDRAWYAACLAKAHSAAGDLDAASDLAGAPPRTLSPSTGTPSTNCAASRQPSIPSFLASAATCLMHSGRPNELTA